MYSIYVHTTPDGRKYVGSTSKEPNSRFRRGRGYRNSTRFYDAIKSVGWDNIQHEIIETVEDKETALKREEYYTLLWRTNELGFGYNIYVGNIQDEDTKNKHSEKMKGRKPSEESKNKMSEKHKGIKHSEETKNRISENLKGRKHSEEHIKKVIERKKKPIIMKNTNTDEIFKFDSRKSCAKFFGVSNSSVYLFLKGTHTIDFFSNYKILSK